MPNYKVINGKVFIGGTLYRAGDIVSVEQEVGSSMLRVLEPVAVQRHAAEKWAIEPEDVVHEGEPGLTLADKSVYDGMQLISMASRDEVLSLLDEERIGKNRKSLINALESRLKYLDGNGENKDD